MDQPPTDPRLMAQMLMSQGVPLPRPDPRGPVQYVGPPREDWRQIGPDGLEVERGTPPPPVPPPPPQYGLGDHTIALLRRIFEGERYREEMMRAGARDPSGLYDRQ